MDFTKTLHGNHLWLSVYKNINVKFFLELDNLADLLLDGLNILFLRNPIK
jgi:hypothetical protein